MALLGITSAGTAMDGNGIGDFSRKAEAGDALTVAFFGGSHLRRQRQRALPHALSGACNGEIPTVVPKGALDVY